ncbi:MAG: hypothetical protein ACTHN7_04015 [Solirubrobacterales bacterium]
MTATAAQAEITSTAECGEPSLSQHFLPANDRNWYAPVPGQDDEGFEGEGWTLSGGASIVSTTDAKGQPVSVLNLPSGSKAVSPTVCVTREYPTARMLVRNLVGSEGVFFYVSYAGTSTWNKPKNTGQVHGTGTAWTLATPINLQPNGVDGWQLVKFTFIPGGKASLFQIYDFWVDPFARH